MYQGKTPCMHYLWDDGSHREERFKMQKVAIAFCKEIGSTFCTDVHLIG